MNRILRKISEALEVRSTFEEKPTLMETILRTGGNALRTGGATVGALTGAVLLQSVATEAATARLKGGRGVGKEGITARKRAYDLETQHFRAANADYAPWGPRVPFNKELFVPTKFERTPVPDTVYERLTATPVRSSLAERQYLLRGNAATGLREDAFGYVGSKAQFFKTLNLDPKTIHLLGQPPMGRTVGGYGRITENVPGIKLLPTPGWFPFPDTARAVTVDLTNPTTKGIRYILAHELGHAADLSFAKPSTVPRLFARSLPQLPGVVMAGATGVYSGEVSTPMKLGLLAAAAIPAAATLQTEVAADVNAMRGLSPDGKIFSRVGRKVAAPYVRWRVPSAGAYLSQASTVPLAYMAGKLLRRRNNELPE
jgi:hypothetical protein